MILILFYFILKISAFFVLYLLKSNLKFKSKLIILIKHHLIKKICLIYKFHIQEFKKVIKIIENYSICSH